jgi:hypothetical protein
MTLDGGDREKRAEKDICHLPAQQVPACVIVFLPN